MTTFKRKFAIENVGDDRLMRDFLSLWRPAGAAAGDNGLRLAIRKNYVNFYRNGQSVAKMSVSDNNVKAEIHGKYIDEGQTSQEYNTILAKNYVGKAQLIDWVSKASQSKGLEKTIVDLLVSNNPNVIDLEMALPFDKNVSYDHSNMTSEDKVKKVAVRMDLVALEKKQDGWYIVFWEAKLATNPEARRRGSEMPRVNTQLKNYRAWVKQNRDVVIKEYINTCQLLCEFHSLAAKGSPNISPLGEGIVAVAKEKQLKVDDRPRLIIDNGKDADGKENLSFEENGHLVKLRNAGIHVQTVKTDGVFVLESLQ